MARFSVPMWGWRIFPVREWVTGNWNSFWVQGDGITTSNFSEFDFTQLPVRAHFIPVFNFYLLKPFSITHLYYPGRCCLSENYVNWLESFLAEEFGRLRMLGDALASILRSQLGHYLDTEVGALTKVDTVTTSIGRSWMWRCLYLLPNQLFFMGSN